MSESSLEDALKGEDSQDSKPDEESKVEDGSTTEQKAEPDSQDSSKLAAAEAQARDERKKRQRLQQRLDELERKIDQGNKKAPDPVEDPEGALSHQREEIENLLVRERISLSRAMMQDQHDDYDEMESKFLDMAEANPALKTQMLQAPLPAQFVYKTAKADVKPVDIDAIRAEMKKEILAELKGQIPDTPSLAGERAAGDDSTPVEETLAEILGR